MAKAPREPAKVSSHPGQTTIRVRLITHGKGAFVMGASHKVLAIVSMGAVLAAFTALGLANPGGGAPGQEEGLKRASPAPLAPGDRAPKPAAGDRKARTEDGGCRCCAGADGACCSTADGKFAGDSILLARVNPGTAQQAKSQEKAKKQSTGDASQAPDLHASAFRGHAGSPRLDLDRHATEANLRVEAGFAGRKGAM
jgi:hypothetical protein